ncbi:MAG: hypothetical protein QE277_04280 [Flectobacillus sp.]|jgi:hypothetical protein|nr:hypothetical protein [Flectobacillus sp.]
MPQQDSKNIMQKVLIIVSVITSMAYTAMGVYLIAVPDSGFAIQFLPSDNWAYVFGAVLIVYGLYRAWRAYEKVKESMDEEGDDE